MKMVEGLIRLWSDQNADGAAKFEERRIHSFLLVFDFNGHFLSQGEFHQSIADIFPFDGCLRN